MSNNSVLYKNIDIIANQLTTFDSKILHKYYNNIDEVKEFPAVLIIPDGETTDYLLAEYRSGFFEYNYILIILTKLKDHSSISDAYDDLAYFAEQTLCKIPKMHITGYNLFGTVINNTELLGIEVKYKQKY